MKAVKVEKQIILLALQCHLIAICHLVAPLNCTINALLEKFLDSKNSVFLPFIVLIWWYEEIVSSAPQRSALISLYKSFFLASRILDFFSNELSFLLIDMLVSSVSVG